MDIRRVISVIVLNEHGVLSRISGLFAGRGYNIESLTVAPIPNSNLSRFTIVSSGSGRVIEQIIKQLHKLIPVLKVFETEEMVEKEMALIKFGLENLSEIEVLLKANNGKIVDMGSDFIIGMVADEPNKIANFIKAIEKFKPKDIVKSGVVALQK